MPFITELFLSPLWTLQHYVAALSQDACLRTVGGNWNTRRKSMQTQGEHTEMTNLQPCSLYITIFYMLYTLFCL